MCLLDWLLVGYCLDLICLAVVLFALVFVCYRLGIAFGIVFKVVLFGLCCLFCLVVCVLFWLLL